MNKMLDDVLKRARNWPESAQQELAAIASEIETELSAGSYKPTRAELEGIERGIADAEAGRFAADSEVEAVFAKHRRS
jgi:predicted transcriptional regulator